MGLNTGASRFDSWFPPWQLWRSRLKPPRIRSPSLPRRLSDTGIIQHHIMEAAMKSSVFQSNECHPPPPLHQHVCSILLSATQEMLLKNNNNKNLGGGKSRDGRSKGTQSNCS